VLEHLFQYKNVSGETEWFAFGFALMETKSKTAYEAVFSSLQSKWVKLGCTPRFTKFLTDFERGEMIAIASIFGHEKVPLNYSFIVM
jgi:hypothetical protein